MSRYAVTTHETRVESLNSAARVDRLVATMVVSRVARKRPMMVLHGGQLENAGEWVE